MEHLSEDQVRSKKINAGDSLAERKKMKSGVNVEPQADEWTAKPSPYKRPESSHE